MDDDDEIEGFSRVEQWEHLAELFKPPSAAAITVTLTADEAQQVRDALLAAAAYVAAEIEGDKVTGRPPDMSSFAT